MIHRLRPYSMGFLLGLCFAGVMIRPNPFLFVGTLIWGGIIAWDLIESAGTEEGNNS